MSRHCVFQVECDACYEIIDSFTSAPAAAKRAADAGWTLGRGSKPDLCKECAETRERHRVKFETGEWKS
jgi:hypothetical protein